MNKCKCNTCENRFKCLTTEQVFSDKDYQAMFEANIALGFNREDAISAVNLFIRSKDESKDKLGTINKPWITWVQPNITPNLPWQWDITYSNSSDGVGR